MSEEIKEILEQLKDSVDYPKFDMPTFDGTDSEFIDNDTLLEPDKCKLLLDYITNLQQENEKLEKENKELNRMCELYSQSLYNADLTKAEDEIERLNNIINELEKYMIKEQARIVINNTDEDEFIYTDLLIKLKELKDSD